MFQSISAYECLDYLFGHLRYILFQGTIIPYFVASLHCMLPMTKNGTVRNSTMRNTGAVSGKLTLVYSIAGGKSGIT